MIASIGQIGPRAAGAVPALIAALKDEVAAVRAAAANALGNIGPDAKGAAPPLTEALTDDAASVRVNAAIALAKIDGKAAVALPVLVDVVENRSHGRQAERALGERGRNRRHPPLN